MLRGSRGSFEAKAGLQSHDSNLRQAAMSLKSLLGKREAGGKEVYGRVESDLKSE